MQKQGGYASVIEALVKQQPFTLKRGVSLKICISHIMTDEAIFKNLSKGKNNQKYLIICKAKIDRFMHATGWKTTVGWWEMRKWAYNDEMKWQSGFEGLGDLLLLLLHMLVCSQNSTILNG